METLEIKRKRLFMRSIRRGIKEMDLILQAFAEAHLEGMDAGQLEVYDRFLAENDHDLYQWVSGQTEPLADYAELVDVLRVEAVGVTKP